jgi:hypothetical protein
MRINKICTMCEAQLPDDKADNVPNQHFWGTPPNWVMDDFYLALGRLINDFARAESVLYYHLLKLMRELNIEKNAIENNVNTVHKKLRDFAVWVKGDAANLESEILSKGQRIKFWGMIEGIAALIAWADRPEGQVRKIKEFAAQIRLIGDLRNELAHSGAYADLRNKHGWYYTSNNKGNCTNTELRYFKISLLEAASNDLCIMPQKLMTILYPDDPYTHSNSLAKARDEGMYMSPESQEYLSKILGAWEYKEEEWLWNTAMEARYGWKGTI